MIGGTFKNTHFGFVSGHYNALANGVYDSQFVDNDYAMASWTSNETNMPPGGTFFGYRSTNYPTSRTELISSSSNTS